MICFPLGDTDGIGKVITWWMPGRDSYMIDMYGWKISWEDCYIFHHILFVFPNVEVLPLNPFSSYLHNIHLKTGSYLLRREAIVANNFLI